MSNLTNAEITNQIETLDYRIDRARDIIEHHTIRLTNHYEKIENLKKNRARQQAEIEELRAMINELPNIKKLERYVISSTAAVAAIHGHIDARITRIEESLK